MRRFKRNFSVATATNGYDFISKNTDNKSPITDAECCNKHNRMT